MEERSRKGERLLYPASLLVAFILLIIFVINLLLILVLLLVLLLLHPYCRTKLTLADRLIQLQDCKHHDPDNIKSESMVRKLPATSLAMRCLPLYMSMTCSS